MSYMILKIVKIKMYNIFNHCYSIAMSEGRVYGHIKEKYG